MQQVHAGTKPRVQPRVGNELLPWTIHGRSHACMPLTLHLLFLVLKVSLSDCLSTCHPECAACGMPILPFSLTLHCFHTAPVLPLWQRSPPPCGRSQGDATHRWRLEPRTLDRSGSNNRHCQQDLEEGRPNPVARLSPRERVSSNCLANHAVESIRSLQAIEFG